MKLVGANPNASVRGANELPGKANYFIGNRPARWRANVPTYGRVVYQGVYPGVDLAYYGTQGRLEYDFVVAPGADPNLIALRVGAVREPPWAVAAAIDAPLRIAANGDLIVRTDHGEVVFHKPVVYQTSRTPNPESRTPVAGHYRLTGDQVTFEVGTYDRTRPLIIDPALGYSTFLGGTATTSASSIAVDATGDAFITGGTTSVDFPVTGGVFQPSLKGTQNVFVTELNPTGTAQVYSTYLGGSGTDTGFGIAVDASGNAYITGATNSTNFPTTAGVKQTALKGGNDVFVSKLTAGGASLLFSTYLGGSLDDQGNAIAVDSSGDTYITGVTASTDFPTTQFPYQIATGGGFDAFVVELNPSGGAPLNYGTYLGGTGNDIGHDLAIPAGCSSKCKVYVAGETSSTNIVATAGAAQTANGGGSDAFVAEIDPAQSGTPGLVYFTYLGGSGDDFGFGIALDVAGDAYVTGETGSSNFPVTAGVAQSTFGGGPANLADDAFVTKVNPTGTAPFVYSTYLGGSGFDRGNSIAVDVNGNAYVTGNTQSTNFPVASPIQSVCSGLPCDDAFVSSLNATATPPLLYSTYLGGSAHDEGDKIVLDSSANAYIAGFTTSSDFPTTPGAFQSSCLLSGTGACNAALVFKLVAAASVETVPSVISFGPQLLNTASGAQTATLTNNGATSLTITSITPSGDFAVAITGTTCSTSTPVAVGASCAIAVTFTPTATGARSGAVTIADNATNTPQVVTLTGTGTSSLVTLAPASLTFSQSVGSTSVSQQVTLTNTGAATLNITSIAVSAPYAETNTCGASVGPGLNCKINVTFAPTKSGSANGTLTITDSAPNSPQTITLTGTGVASAVTLAPTSLNFNSENIGVTSAAQSVTVTNSGNATLSAINVTLTGTNAGDFKISANTCGASLATGTSCTIMATFTPMPSSTASRSAMLSIADNAPDSPQSVALSGMGADFTTAASPTSASVSAGRSATFSLTEASVGGFNSAVALACTAPTGFLGSCTVSPASVTPSGTTPGTATVTVSTLAPAGLAPVSGPPHLLPGPGMLLRLPWFAWLLGLTALALAIARRKRLMGLALAATMLFVILGVSCGGSSATVSPGTLPGTYTFTITGTSNSLAHSTTVTVTVTG